LAIELAARWMRSATPAVIAERLASDLDLLATSAPDVERRHQSLRSVIDWSWQLLTDDEQCVLARLSVFRGGFTLDAAGAVTGATLPLLAALVDHSLVSVAEDGRYVTHELLRQYAAEQLAGDPADDQATRERHARHYAALLPDPAEAGATDEGVDAEVENLRPATDWLVEHADPTRLDTHLVRLMPFYGRKGWFREAQAVLTVALEHAGVPPVQRARWHRLLGEAYLQLGEVSPARQHFERTLALLGSSPPGSTPGWLDMLASQALHRQLRQLRPHGVVGRGEEQRVRAAERAAVCWQMVEACWVLEDWTALLPLSLFGLNQAERAGRLDLAARNQIIVGMVAGITGLHRLARRHVQAAVRATNGAGDPVTICWTQLVGGLHWGGVGDWATLEARLGQALSAAAGARLHRLADQVMLTGSICRYLTGRFAEAAAMAADVRASGRERRDLSVHLWGLVALMESRLRLDPGDPAIAGWIEEAEQLIGNVARIDAARVHVATARFHLAAGRTADAWRAARAAAERAGSEPSFVQYTLEAHAGIPEICLALLERGQPTGVDPAELRATAAAGLRRLRRYARSIPMAQPRALACLGRWYWLKDQRGAARRAWARAAQAAERLAMPWELAYAHYELGRHLGVDARSSLGLDRTDHLDKAKSTFEALGCRTERITSDRDPRGWESILGG
jgi:tetratricopeptide (TPR) repeat protein